jgi:protein O-mannosyl-transferase
MPRVKTSSASTRVAPQPERGRRRLSAFLVPAAAIIALAIAAHAPAIGAGFIWDDDAYVTANPYLFDGSGLHQIWFRVGATNLYAPVLFSTFWLEQHLWGLNPLGYHLVNVVLHAGCALLLWALLRRIAVPGAWLAGAMFAVHPVLVESVAWVTELKNMESTFFYLLCLLAYFRFTPLNGGDERSAERRWTWYALALVLFAAGLMSKPAGVSLPLANLVMIWWKRGTLRKFDVAATVPMLAMSLVAGLVTIYVDAYYLGGMGPALQLSPVDRILVAGRSLWFYAGKLLWPAPLVSIYPRWEVSAAVWWQYLYPIAAVATLVALWGLRRRIGRGPLAAVASFVIIVSPTIGLTNFSYYGYSFVADRLVYQAAPALMALFAAGVVALQRALREYRLAQAVSAAAAVLLLFFSLLSEQHARAFQDEKTRCLDTLAKNPTAWVAMNNLGVALNAEGKPREAVHWYEEAIRIRGVYPEAHNNLGVALVALGDVPGAVAHYREALRLWPNYPAAHNNLGTALVSTGDGGEAVQHYRQALRLRSDYAEAHNNLAVVLGSTGDVDEAIREHREALRIRPNYAEAHADLGVTLTAARRFGEAIEEYQHSLRMNPQDAKTHNGLGRALASTGRMQDAIGEFEAALRLEPDYAEAHNNLGTALASTGDTAAATRHFREAVRIKSDFAEAHSNLGIALATAGRLDEAIEHFERAVQIQPGDGAARDNLSRARELRRQSGR